MKCNVGGIDRGIRGVTALAAIGAMTSKQVKSKWRIAAALTEAMACFTFFTRYCPLNQAIGLDTCKR